MLENKKLINFYKVNKTDDWIKKSDKAQNDITFVEDTKSIYLGELQYSSYKEHQDLKEKQESLSKSIEEGLKHNNELLEIFQEWINYNEALKRYDNIKFLGKHAEILPELNLPKIIEKVYLLMPWHLRVSLTELMNSIVTEGYEAGSTLAMNDSRSIEIEGPGYRSDVEKYIDMYKNTDDNKYTPEADEYIIDGSTRGVIPSIKYTMVVPPFGTTPSILWRYGKEGFSDDDFAYSRHNQLNYKRTIAGVDYYVPDYNIIGDNWLTNEKEFLKTAGVGTRDYIIEAYCCNLILVTLKIQCHLISSELILA